MIGEALTDAGCEAVVSPAADIRDLAGFPPTSQVRKLAAAVGARSHVTFAGRLTPDAKGFPASAMAKRSAATGATRRTSAAG